MERSEVFEQLQALLKERAQLLKEIAAIIRSMQLAVQCLQTHLEQECLNGQQENPSPDPPKKC